MLFIEKTLSNVNVSSIAKIRSIIQESNVPDFNDSPIAVKIAPKIKNVIFPQSINKPESVTKHLYNGRKPLIR
ncbi:hypothetical protein GsuE55_27760 [Geobacillus subterraneus]|uniref:Uncharacterized protein n=1 Tax=Geobacillus subterraneus TaxID=129338 RepID=A0A679FPH1_9BACL|nr:hypothetical protein GsuE55_27760 [Geobacillus subterraneus]